MKGTIIENIKNMHSDLTKSEIEGILYLISSKSSLTNSELVRETGLPKETLRSVKSLLSSFLEDREDDTISVKAEYLPKLSEMDLRPYSWSLLEYEDKDLEERLLSIRKKYNLEPKREYDQFFATVKTSVAKAMILKEKGLIKGKRIVLLGDDDLVSIVLGMMGEGHLQITVLDIDRDILAAIDKISADMSLKGIRTEYSDVRKGVSTNLIGVYDVALTDPPYTRNGVSLFLNTCVELLRDNTAVEGKYVFLYFGNSYKSPEKTLKIQDVITEANLLIEDRVNKFARYHGAESIGSASSLYILKTTPFTKAVFSPVQLTNIYTFEDQKEDRFPFVDHYTMKIYKVPANIVGSKKAMLKLAGDFCNIHKLKVIDTIVSKFKGKGLTITFVLGTSNLLIHTWPEMNAVHMDLITCSPIHDKEQLAQTVSDLFKTNSIELRKIE